MKSVSWLRAAGFFTWAMVGLPTFLNPDPMPTRHFSGWLVCWLVFAICFWIASTRHCRHSLVIPLMLAQTLAALTGVYLRPNAFGIVLLVVVAGEISGVVSGRTAAIWIVLQTAAATGLLIQQNVPLRFVTPAIGSYLAFQAFAYFTGYLTASERKAQESLTAANAELRASAELLEVSSRLGERLRIARDLHDLLGHHLTALTVNLEVASHLTDGKPREHIEQARGLAKLLLSDVRAVVSDLRDDQRIDLKSMLERLVAPIPHPRIALRVDEALTVDDPALAQTLVHAVQEIITNTMRHAEATELTIDLARSGDAIELRSSDDGRGARDPRDGNGLRGMRERAEAAGGTLQVETAPREGFRVRMTVPNEGTV
jgi:signal transduction histidine kinase